jgi:hypothetical protein
VLPDQEVDGNEYLITTSFIAPNCEGAVRDMDNEPFCKPYDTHDIIDRAATLREGPYYPDDWNDWDDDCVIEDSEISKAVYYWKTLIPINGHTVTDSEMSLLVYQWKTGDVC